MDHPTHELEAYFSDDATDEQFATIETWINADKANAQAFMQQLHFRELLGTHLREQCGDNRAVLAELTRLEAAQQPEIVTLIDLDSQKPSRPHSTTSKSDYAAAASYLLGHTFTPKRLAYAGLAAAIFLGITIFLVLQGGNTPPPVGPTDFVQTPEDVEAPQRIVATHNATWSPNSAGGALALPVPGTQLHPGDRLTLTAGFAEITTNRGAVVTLEAPCTIEMIDRDNGLELLQGKLVGHCPTRQSQGFLVRTPSTQVIDLGTEFGVEVDTAGVTDVYVFTGLVALADPQDDPRVAELTEVAAGQGKRVDRQGHISSLTKADAGDRFVRSVDAGASYERLVLADKPLIYYRMDKIIGGIERNRAADRYHAKIFGDVTSATEVGRSSFSLNTSGDYLQTTEPIAELRGAESYTIECWVRATRYDFGVICQIMQMGADQSFASPTGARLETLGKSGVSTLGGSNKLRFVQYENVGTEPSDDNLQRSNAFSKSNYPLGRWVHLAAVKSGQAMALYLDGEPVGYANEPQSLADADVAIQIGKFFGTKDSPSVHIRQFLGQLDELAIYDHALSIEAIRARVGAGQDWTSP